MLHSVGSGKNIKEIKMIEQAIKKVSFISLDGIYFISCIFLLLLIKSDENIFDIIYFIVITIYYIRIKINRRKS